MITRFESISINTLSFATSPFGEQGVSETLWFKTRAKVHEVNSSIKISDKYRDYHDITEFEINYTQNARTIVEDPGNYSITYDGKAWRIEDAKSDNNRQHVRLLCFRNDPQTAV